METSKKLLWVFVVFFILSIITVGLIEVLFKTNLSYLLNYVMPLSTSVVLGYIGKSGVENVTKIKTNANGNIQLESNGNSIEVDNPLTTNTSVSTYNLDNR